MCRKIARIASAFLLVILAITLVTYIAESGSPPHDMSLLGLVDAVLLFYVAPWLLLAWLICVVVLFLG